MRRSLFKRSINEFMLMGAPSLEARHRTTVGVGAMKSALTSGPTRGLNISKKLIARDPRIASS
jgi:hypothetical protein